MREKMRALAMALAVPLAYLLIQMIVSLVCGTLYLLSWMPGHNAGDQGAMNQALNDFWSQNGLYLTLATALLGIVPAIMILRRQPAADRAALFRPPDGMSALHLVLCGLSLNVLIGLMLSLVPFPDSLLEQYGELMQTLSGGSPVINFAVVCLVVPLAEELLFRGLCYRTLRRAFPVWAALVMQSLLFAVFHGNVIQAVGVLPVALLLGLAFEWSGSLTAAILLHMAFNSANALLSLLPGDQGLSAWIVPLSAVTAAGSIAWLYKRRIAAQDGQTPGV